MSGYVEEAQDIIREDGLLIFTHRIIAKTYRTTLRRLMPEVGYPELNGVAVPEYGNGAPGKNYLMTWHQPVGIEILEHIVRIMRAQRLTASRNS
jgi:hypothetical protein